MRQRKYVDAVAVGTSKYSIPIAYKYKIQINQMMKAVHS